jgi:hypothetical protein
MRMKRVPWERVRTRGPYAGPVPSTETQEGYGEFLATELYCPRCAMAVPVRERLLLVLPDGELYEYLCMRCGASVGEKKAKGRENIRIVVA